MEKQATKASTMSLLELKRFKNVIVYSKIRLKLLIISKRVNRHECLREHQQPKVHKSILPVF